ncbi:DUF5815 family protein [Halopelagius longus]|uniref:Uncharacterized protein n=1 Tax=Halopelagius longus TaxID=1236180 RepID=A0A1H0YAQ7_9EURY|nr:DUF5815 family protein [Halopelagius longus]RDI72381.1 hypothetical protein DWB78_12015 [Halopelagius longus]SDQ12192.1 hypothetical protein SAMN05216278_0515 [Halopelagius longus]
MAQPRVPGGGGEELDLPCGETKSVRSLDLGMREFECSCGERHAVVMDVHPPERFLPEFLVEILREAVETTSDEMPEFGTPHLMGIALEEFPKKVVSADVSDDGEVGTGIIWVADFDSRRLHEILVELVVELMEHAISHADDESAISEFEAQMLDFDVAEFVEEYRAQRDISEDDLYA